MTDGERVINALKPVMMGEDRMKHTIYHKPDSDPISPNRYNTLSTRPLLITFFSPNDPLPALRNQHYTHLSPAFPMPPGRQKIRHVVSARSYCLQLFGPFRLDRRIQRPAPLIKSYVFFVMTYRASDLFHLLRDGRYFHK